MKYIKIYKVIFLILLCQGSSFAQKSSFSVSTNNSLRHSYFPPNGCNITVDAGPDITICAGIGKQIKGNVTGGYSSIGWDPIDGLSNPNVANPIATPMSTTIYTLIAKGMSANLFLNGGFESGGIAPSTSSYTFYNNLNSFAMSTGGYMVLSVPLVATQFGCNPPIGAFTLAVTPTVSSVNFLCQTISVSPNTVYKIKFKCFGIPYIFGAPPAVNCTINGNSVGTLDVESGLCVESDADFMWNSGAAVSANICFSNSGGTGFFSMFSIDDIEFKECCEVKDEVKVTVYEIVADIAVPEEINCNNMPLELDGSGSSMGPNINYEWTTIDGKIISGDKTNKVKVGTPGNYTLRVIGEFGCEKMVSVKVTGNITPPDISVSNTDISCLKPTAEIKAISKTNPVSFEWTGPNGYSSSKASNFNITEPGDYEVIVIDDYGCKSIKKLTVKDNRTEVYLELKGDTIQCGEDSVKLIASSQSPKPSFIWKYRDTIISIRPTSTAKDTGWYFLTVFDSLGCFALDSFKVLSFQTKVPTSINADKINCINTKVQLKLSTDTSGSVLWKGPNGFNSILTQPFVQDTGWYFLTVSTKGGCKGNDSIFVSSDFKIPDIYISSPDTLRCNKSQVKISGRTSNPLSTLSWLGPNGILGNDSSYIVSDSGDYALIVSGENGCLNSAQVKIYKILDTPILFLRDDTLDCIKKSIVLNVSNDTSIQFNWTGPNGFNSNLHNPTINTDGEYQVLAISQFGCPKFGIVNIIQDTTAPTLSIQLDTLTCFRTDVTPKLNSDPDIVSYIWSGPNNFNSNLQNPTLSIPGKYIIKVQNSKSCSTEQEIILVEDIAKPLISISADDIVCNKQAFIYVNSISNNAKVFWKGPNNFTSDSLKNQVTLAGWYIVTATSSNGCVTIDSVLVIQKDNLPDLTTKDDTLTCSKTNLNLFAESQTPGVKYSWTGPNNFSSQIKNPNINIGGVYTVKITDPSGCELTKQINISVLNSNSILQLTNLDSLTCKLNLANIILNSNNNLNTISWTGPNNYFSSNQNITINTGGWYKVNTVNEFGCLSSDSIFIVDYRVLPIATTADDSLNCQRKMISLSLNSSEPNLKFSWSGPNGFTSIIQNPTVNSGGIFTVTITNEYNCELIKFLTIKLDTTAPDLSLSADTLTCKRSTVPIKAGTSLQGFNILWTGPAGFTSMFPQAIVNTAGIYTCTLTNPRNKCFTTKIIQLIEDTNRIRTSTLDFEDAQCGLKNGSININSIIGGSAPFEYSIDNGLSYFNQSIFTGLSSGNYNLKIRDRNGCEFSGTVVIKDEQGIDISLPTNIELSLNEQINLNLIINNSNNPTILWSPSDQLSCNNCTNPVLTGTKDQVISVVVTDANGCTDIASISVHVKSDIQVFVPNTFSPNGDNINDYFFPKSNTQSVLISNMSIYSRWGELIFSKDDLEANSERDGWNGMFSGKNLNPGVYVYKITYTANNKVEIIYGDVTLFR
ncbi:MAG: gliding motility-associated C-terminal domain-containing protein [Saprospiraceae bacterium]